MTLPEKRSKPDMAISTIIEGGESDDDTESAPFRILATRHNARSSPTKIEIISSTLISILKEACINFPGTEYAALFTDKVILVRPFMMLFYNLDKIQELATTTHLLNTLLSLMLQQDSWITLQKLQTQACRTLTFSNLWLLYRPGITVYQRPMKDGDSWHAFKIGRSSYHKQPNETHEELRIRYFGLVLDPSAKRLVPQMHVLNVYSYTGVRFVADLRLVPGEFITKDHLLSLRANLERRGRKYWSFNGRALHQEYSGSAWRKTSKPEKLKVMVDHATTSEHGLVESNRLTISHDGCSCTFCARKYVALPSHPPYSSGNLNSCPMDPYPMLDPPFAHDDKDRHPPNPYLFCPSHVRAFSFKYRSWQLIEVDALTDVKKCSELVENLVLVERSKSLLQMRIDDFLMASNTLGSEHDAPALTILLQGPPGTGKTASAEAIAAAKRKPLYIISWPDQLGICFDAFEQRIHEAFHNAENWEAVLALDKADMLLQPPDTLDVKSRDYASVVWQKLAQYRGICLIMSSLDEHRISEAARSLISITIRLPPLSIDARASIWTILIDAITNTEDRAALAKLTASVSTFNVNGHQLRNCLDTALALVRRGDKPIRKRHIELALAHDATFVSSGHNAYQEESPRRPQITHGSSSSIHSAPPEPLLRPRHPLRAESGGDKSVRFDGAACPFPSITSPAAAATSMTSSSATSTPTTDTTPVTLTLSNDKSLLKSPMKPRSPPKSPRLARHPSARPPRSTAAAAAAAHTAAAQTRPGILIRRHTTQGSLDPPASTGIAADGSGGEWTWRMLPAAVRRPQLQHEKDLPDTDDEGTIAARRKEKEKEVEGDSSME